VRKLKSSELAAICVGCVVATLLVVVLEDTTPVDREEAGVDIDVNVYDFASGDPFFLVFYTEHDYFEVFVDWDGDPGVAYLLEYDPFCTWYHEGGNITPFSFSNFTNYAYLDFSLKPTKTLTHPQNVVPVVLMGGTGTVTFKNYYCPKTATTTYGNNLPIRMWR